MSNMNRLGNVANKFQGRWKRVLCVCSGGILRSPTIAWVLGNEPYNCNVRVVGTLKEYALVPIDDVLLTWADEIVCAEKHHADEVHNMIENYIIPDKPVHILNVPDHFEFRDPELVGMIRDSLTDLGFRGTSKE